MEPVPPTPFWISGGHSGLRDTKKQHPETWPSPVLLCKPATHVRLGRQRRWGWEPLASHNGHGKRGRNLHYNEGQGEFQPEDAEIGLETSVKIMLPQALTRGSRTCCFSAVVTCWAWEVWTVSVNHWKAETAPFKYHHDLQDGEESSSAGIDARSLLNC